MKFNIFLLQFLLLIVWYAVPAAAAWPLWLVFLPMIFLAVILFFMLLLLAIAVAAGTR